MAAHNHHAQNGRDQPKKRYDKMTARELCRRCGMSEKMYEKFLKPTLLVGLFAPPEDISAAVMLETLEFYALGHQNSFDVCWPKGPIAELIFAPLVRALFFFAPVRRRRRRCALPHKPPCRSWWASLPRLVLLILPHPFARGRRRRSPQHKQTNI